MLRPNPWKSYRQTATLTAPPGQIVLMLYDGTLRFLESALAGFDSADLAERNMTINNNLQRAQRIIRELDCALDFEKGGDLADTLHRLYDYFDRRIVESNLKKTSGGIVEVIQHISELRDAWSSMLNGQGSQPMSIAEAAEPAFAVA
jgi:flagellar secretion chaperone FliS